MIDLGKSLFISVYSAYTMLAALAALVVAARSGGAGGIAWAGVALVHLPMAVLFARVMLLRDTPRTHPLLPLVSVLTLAGLVVTVVSGMLVQPAASRATPLAWATLGTLGYFLYLLWYSRFSRKRPAALEAGATLPTLKLQTTGGDAFDTAALSGSPAILLFYRGNWCPLCVAQIKEIATRYRDLAARGVEVLLISPQPHRKAQRLARRFEAPMRFLVDPGNRNARRLGIDCRHGLPAGMGVLGYASETVLPTVIVVDAEGTILMADQTDNYRVRPEPDTFIAALDAARH